MQITERVKKVRYEATSDLLHELVKKEFDLNEDLASKLSKAVLHQLYDEVCEVSELALRWFVHLSLHFYVIFDCRCSYRNRKIWESVQGITWTWPLSNPGLL